MTNKPYVIISTNPFLRLSDKPDNLFAIGADPSDTGNYLRIPDTKKYNALVEYAQLSGYPEPSVPFNMDIAEAFDTIIAVQTAIIPNYSGLDAFIEELLATTVKDVIYIRTVDENFTMHAYTPSDVGDFDFDSWSPPLHRISDQSDDEDAAADDLHYADVDGPNIDGGIGYDIVVYDSARADASVDLSSDGTLTITEPDGQADHLISIEEVQFDGGSLLFDLESDSAPAAYRLYGGAFDRVPDEAGLRFWIDAVTGGTTLEQAAAGFIASQEFTALYGGNLGNAQFVDQLYLNVLGRSGEDGGVIFWNDHLDDGGDRAVTLVQFTQLPEYVGLSQPDIENGYWVA